MILVYFTKQTNTITFKKFLFSLEIYKLICYIESIQNEVLNKKRQPEIYRLCKNKLFLEKGKFFLSGRLRNGMIEQKKSFFKVFFLFLCNWRKTFFAFIFAAQIVQSTATENKFCGFLRKVKKDDKKNLKTWKKDCREKKNDQISFNCFAP